MRKIKFRAWCKPEKAMFEVVMVEWSAATSDEISRMLLIDLHHPYTVHQIHRSDSAIDTDYVLLQFTGLLDKNGREVYEGDICAVPGGMMYSQTARTMVPGKYQVYWNDDRWGLKDANNEDYDNGDFYQGNEIYWEGLSVIGNIYENPELVK